MRHFRGKKYCIVNGDDLGAGHGVNRGILEAFEHGILTSTSLMVDAPYADEASALARRAPGLSVGLHVAFTNEDGELLLDLADLRQCRRELARQYESFLRRMDRPPTHIDSHHHVHHHHPQLLTAFLELAWLDGLPVREHSPVRYFGYFYGQWDDESHPEQISAENLLRMLEEDVHEGITELGCHPGTFDPDFHSVYGRERETELRTLCDPAVRSKIEELGIELAGFGDLDEILRHQAAAAS